VKKGSLKRLALAFAILVGSVACSHATNSDLSSAAPLAGNEAPGSGSPEAKPSSPSDSGGDTPSSPTPGDPIESAHSLYAAFVGVEKAVVKKSFEAHCADLSSDTVILDKTKCLFSMALELDPQLKIGVESAKNHAYFANKALDGPEPLSGLEVGVFKDTILQLTKDATMIRPRLLKVASIYGIKFYETDLSMAYSVAKYATGRENFLKSLAAKTGGDMSVELGTLYDSVVLLYLNKNLTSNAMTFLDFHHEGIFPIEGMFIVDFGRGGFGALDDLQVRFQGSV